MTFDDTGIIPDQEFDLHPDTSGTLEYSTMLVTKPSLLYLIFY